MRRLIWGFAGRTYHIVGNFMHWLICFTFYSYQHVVWNLYVSDILNMELFIYPLHVDLEPCCDFVTVTELYESSMYTDIKRNVGQHLAWNVDTPGGGGTLNFSSYVGSGPASTLHPPNKYQEFQAPQKYIWNFSNPKIYPHSVLWP